MLGACRTGRMSAFIGRTFGTSAAVMENAKGDSQSCFQADHPKRRAVVFQHFLVLVMRSVVGCDRVNRSVRGRFNQSGAVVFGPQRGAHLRIRIKALYRLVSES